MTAAAARRYARGHCRSVCPGAASTTPPMPGFVLRCSGRPPVAPRGHVVPACGARPVSWLPCLRHGYGHGVDREHLLGLRHVAMPLVAVAWAGYGPTLTRLDDCLYALQATIPRLTCSSLHRCLQRHGISCLSEVEGDKTTRKAFKAYPTGFFHFDIAEVQTAEGKHFLFVAIERTSTGPASGRQAPARCPPSASSAAPVRVQAGPAR